ncbi:MAG: polyribonucleotide nucleotidyltransferase [Myxococcota bacterium]|jgi:polyribonucleotide nucleotidyltransferase|nr:polyribonucleotide nucleotidyltransferase [Myxococcota bacterium]
MSRIIRESVMIGRRELTIETGRMAKQAGGSALVQCGESVVLVTVCGGGRREGIDFFPLSCDYVEKTYAAGRIPGSFFRREGRLGEKETLTSRLIDRPCRPLFPEGFKNEVQITATVLSFDQENDTDVLAISGASVALMLSPLPWHGPIAGVRIGRINGRWIANPSLSEREHSDTNIIMVVSEKAIVMVEGETEGLSEAEFLDAMDFGTAAVKELLALQRRLAAAVGKPKNPFESPKLDAQVLGRVRQQFGGRIRETIQIREKLARYAALDLLKKEVLATLLVDFPERGAEIGACYSEIKSETMRGMVTRERKRIDGRRLDEVRPITCEVGVLPRVHGSALFTRGETQALVTLTVGTAGSDQRIEELTGMRSKKFLLHYNFPPFSVGEVKPLRSPGRREIGHGMLAERALSSVMPTARADYPYVLRVVSEILESNGSSSMATVCGGTLAAMDAGLDIRAPVAGIAMGLIKEGDDVAVLSDILGDEDHLGDMDFKVCGTAEQITAIQMDVKIEGISRELMASALEQARRGRVHILERMAAAIAESRRDMSPYAPRIVAIKINPDKIRDVIGAGGKVIRGIVAKTGANVNVDDDGTVTVASDNQEALNEALAIVRGLVRVPVAGEVYLGTVRKILEFGAFVELFPGTDGLLHISELSEGHVDSVTDVVREGEEVLVKVLAVDRMGKVRLSRKAALADA